MLVIRDATQADLPALVNIRNAPAQFVRYRSLADGQAIRLLVCEQAEQVVGFAMLYLRQPTKRNMAKSHIPKISDLYIAAPFRCQGIGSTFIAYMEDLALAFGHQALYVSVDPIENPRAMALYQRLGYAPLLDQPYQKVATWYDEAGNVTQRMINVMPMVKRLGQREG